MSWQNGTFSRTQRAKYLGNTWENKTKTKNSGETRRSWGNTKMPLKIRWRTSGLQLRTHLANEVQAALVQQAGSTPGLDGQLSQGLWWNFQENRKQNRQNKQRETPTPKTPHLPLNRFAGGVNALIGLHEAASILQPVWIRGYPYQLEHCSVRGRVTSSFTWCDTPIGSCGVL